LTIAASPFAAPTIASARGIRVLRLTGDKGTFALEPGRHSVGRSDAAGVPILDPQVSRAHAAISIVGFEARVEDTGSSNGTFLNGVRVPAGGVVIKSGDRLAFGSLEFTVELVS
jgi:S-DNA-T family DNA segregation ATPase FtsK/SpoIIIE